MPEPVDARPPVLNGVRVALYDPSPLNPYGRELSQLLAQSGAHVDWHTTADTHDVPSKAVSRLAILGGGLRQRASFGAFVKRIVGPIRFAMTSRRASHSILVWTRDPWDRAIFLLTALFGHRFHIVYHNPPQVRPQRAVRLNLEQALLRRAVVCVHSQFLAEFASIDFSVVRITPHPPYSVTVAKAPPRHVDPRLVIFLGALRSDKGTTLLPDVIRSCRASFVFSTVGSGQLSAGITADWGERGISYEVIGGDRPASEVELLKSLREAAVVLAPYTQPTESGSVLLAMYAGTPVLGLDSPGLSRILNTSSRFRDARELGEALTRFLDVPWETFSISPADQTQESRKAWEGLLSDRTGALDNYRNAQ